MDELEFIRRLWRTEEQDWEDSVPKIYREVLGENLVEWLIDEQPGFTVEERALLDTICDRYGVPSAMTAKLLDIERAHHGMTRRSSIHQKIASVFDEDWRSEQEILAREAKPES